MKRLCGFLLAAILLASAGQVPGARADEPVASVTLIAGSAWRLTAAGERLALREGDSLFEGDSIVTAANGVVYLRFRDQARLAVRPSSTVAIVRYRTDPGTESMQLDVSQGSVRQISGEAAKRAPERYRLNTPIAVLGVRGTDFAVRAQAEQVETLLFEGAIVAAPRAACADLAGCDAVVSITLDAPAWRIYRDGRIEPLSAGERDLLLPQLAQPRSNPAPSTASSNPHLEKPEPTVKDPEPSVPAQALAWARWLPHSAAPLGATLDELQALGLAPVAANASYLLMRETPAGTPLDTALRGQAHFVLDRAEAALVRFGMVAEPAEVRDAHLSVQFDARRFDAAATLAHPQVGALRVAGAGDITQDGRFGLSTNTERILGALTTDGRRAGVLFEARPDAATRLEALTTWSR